MTEREMEEIDEYIDNPTEEGVEKSIISIQAYTKNAIYRNLKASVSILRSDFNIFKSKTLLNTVERGDFAEIIDRLIAIFEEFKVINSNNNTPIIPVSVYVFTATNATITTTLPQTIYELLDSAARYSDDPPKWLPFPEDLDSIQIIMNNLLNTGYVFDVIYIRENEILSTKDKQDIIAKIALQITNVVAIIDLLAINKNNEEVATAFSNPTIRRAMTPIDSRLDRKVQQYMKDVRERIYWQLNHQLVQSNRGYDFYDSSLGEKNTFVNILNRVLPKRNSKREITDKDQGKSITGLKPSITN